MMDLVAETTDSDRRTESGSVRGLEHRMVGGKYRVRSFLASGGVGVVYEAEHVGLGERVALKFLSSQWAADPAIAERFLREARTQFKIASEHVTRVLDVGTTDWGTAYLVMELVDGESLRELVDRVGFLSASQAAEIVRQASLGLAAAHDIGVVHRDVKGGNMMLADRNGKVCVKVLDFGLASVVSAIQDRVLEARLTPSSLIMGTPIYMAPEQLRGARHATARSDIWSMGVVLYELLTGDKPFDLPALARCVHKGTLPALASVHTRLSEVPTGLADVVTRCLTLDPDGRFENGEDLARAVAPFALPFSVTEVKRPAPTPTTTTVDLEPAASAAGLTRATTKIASADGNTAFEIHELVELPSEPDATKREATTVDEPVVPTSNIKQAALLATSSNERHAPHPPLLTPARVGIAVAATSVFALLGWLLLPSQPSPAPPTSASPAGIETPSSSTPPAPPLPTSLSLVASSALPAVPSQVAPVVAASGPTPAVIELPNRSGAPLPGSRNQVRRKPPSAGGGASGTTRAFSPYVDRW
jgi:serine/threonine-protein kinase